MSRSSSLVAVSPCEIGRNVRGKGMWEKGSLSFHRPVVFGNWEIAGPRLKNSPLYLKDATFRSDLAHFFLAGYWG